LFRFRNNSEIRNRYDIWTGDRLFARSLLTGDTEIQENADMHSFRERIPDVGRMQDRTVALTVSHWIISA
jgi:hypothetical protein